MKKVLSLLLACAMIFSLSSVVGAAGEGYTVTYGSLSTSYDSDFEEYSAAFVKGSLATAASVYDNTTDKTKLYTEAELVSLVFTTNAASAGGYVVIDYDENLVTPVSSATKVSASKGTINVYLENSDDASDWVKSAKASVATLNSAQIIKKASTGEVLVGWFGANGSVAAGTDVFYIHFVCNEGKSSQDFTADTFKLTSNSSAILSENLLSRGAADIAAADGATHYDANQGNISVSFTYPGSDKPAGGETKTTVLAIDAANSKATANVYYETAVSGTAIIAVYDANGTMLNLATKDIATATTDVEGLEVSYAGKGTAKTVKVFVWSGYGSTNVAQVGAETYTAE